MYWLITYAEEGFQDPCHIKYCYMLHIGPLSEWIIRSKKEYGSRWLVNAQSLDEKEYEVIKKSVYTSKFD